MNVQTDFTDNLSLPNGSFIDGEYRPAVSGKTFETTNPFNGDVIAALPTCASADVDAAVRSARAAFKSGLWSGLHPSDRTAVLGKLADLIMENAEELATMEALDAGKPITDCRSIDIPETANCIRWHGEAQDKLYDQIAPSSPDAVGMIVREPVGVVAAVLPWNFPLMMMAWKIGPALATGNSVVVKPAEQPSLTSLRLAELALEAGVPPGVLNVLTGSVATKGGTAGNGMNKFKPHDPIGAPNTHEWNHLEWPREFPLAYHEMSILLPHFLNEGRGTLDVYFSRVYNPIWTNPDGFTWMEALKAEDTVKCHVALTPTWSETSWFADYVLPMGVGAERHDITSYETHAGRWVSFRQPTFRRFAEIQAGGELPEGTRTFEYNPGEVWEENEFWIDLSWKIDPDGSLGIRAWFQSPDDPEKPLSDDEYYG